MLAASKSLPQSPHRRESLDALQLSVLQDLKPDPEGDAASGHPGKLHLLKDVSGVFKPRVLTCLMVSFGCDATSMLPCEAICAMLECSAPLHGCQPDSCSGLL